MWGIINIKNFHVFKMEEKIEAVLSSYVQIKNTHKLDA